MIPENDVAITSPVSSGRPSVAPIQKKTLATGVGGTSQRLASPGGYGPRPRPKVRASPGPKPATSAMKVTATRGCDRRRAAVGARGAPSP